MGEGRAPWWRRWLGSRSERAAARFLKKLGYRVLARNWSCPLGELDLVALIEERELRSAQLIGHVEQPRHLVDGQVRRHLDLAPGRDRAPGSDRGDIDAHRRL